MVDLNDITKRTSTAREYVDALDEKPKSTIMEKYANYRLDGEVVKELESLTGDLTFVVLSAAWCGDCKNAMPVFLHLEETLNLNVRVFGKIKTAPLDPDRKWAIPPSPPEIEEWGATAIPWIEIFNSNGERVGTIIERPRVKPTLEAEILHLLKDK